MDRPKDHKFIKDFFQATLSSPDKTLGLESVPKAVFDEFYNGLEKIAQQSALPSSSEVYTAILAEQ